MRPAFLLMLALAAGCGPAAPDNAFHLATVDYWPEQRLLFVASRGSGAVNVLRVPASPRQGSLDYVERLDEPTRKRVVRLAVDRGRGRLWVADERAVYVHPLEPPGAARVIAVPATDYDDRISDLSIDEHGNAYLHTRGGSLIYRVDAAMLGLEKWLEPFARLPDGGLLSYRRVLHSKDDRHLLFQSPKDGAILRIDLRSREVSRIELPTPVDLGCGLLFWADDWMGEAQATGAADPRPATLTAVHCLGHWIADIHLDAGLRRGLGRQVFGNSAR